MLTSQRLLVLLASTATLPAAGCGASGTPHPEHPVAATASASDHAGWWCGEHGVPEDRCGLCDPQVAADLKAKGDWCAQHDRPDSQCFVCHPEAQSKFAALYEAKFGHAPPALAPHEQK